MAKKTESRLQQKIRKDLQRRFECKFFKVHGSSFQEAGQPDLMGCVDGFFFGFEVKVPGKGKPSILQIETLREWRAVGGIACIVESSEEAIRVVEAITATPGKRSKGRALVRRLRGLVCSEDW